MAKNPQEESYPEGFYSEFKFVVRHCEDSNAYHVSCPEWKFSVTTNAPHEVLSKIALEIVEHNRQEMKERD